MVKNDFIDSTKLALLNSFKDKIDFHADFITDQLLSKPPFGFLQTLVRLYVTELCFAKGLFTEEELRYQKRLPRSEKVNNFDVIHFASYCSSHNAFKIRFLVKIISCTALVTGERVDVFVSPAKILSGQGEKQYVLAFDAK